MRRSVLVSPIVCSGVLVLGLGVRSFALSGTGLVRTNRVWRDFSSWGVPQLAMQAEFDSDKHIWRCDGFHQKVDRFCQVLSEGNGRLMVITDFDRCGFIPVRFPGFQDL